MSTVKKLKRISLFNAWTVITRTSSCFLSRHYWTSHTTFLFTQAITSTTRNSWKWEDKSASLVALPQFYPISFASSDSRLGRLFFPSCFWNINKALCAYKLRVLNPKCLLKLRLHTSICVADLCRNGITRNMGGAWTKEIDVARYVTHAFMNTKCPTKTLFLREHWLVLCN